MEVSFEVRHPPRKNEESEIQVYSPPFCFSFPFKIHHPQSLCVQVSVFVCVSERETSEKKSMISF